MDDLFQKGLENAVDYLVDEKSSAPLLLEEMSSEYRQILEVETGNYPEKLYEKLAILCRQELKRKTIRDIIALYNRVKEEDNKEKIESEPQEYFFTQPIFKANFTRWGRKTYWNIVDDGPALCFGVNPEIMDWEFIHRLSSASPLVKEFLEIKELITQTIDWGDLEEKCTPKDFIAWVKKKNIPFPEELEDLIMYQGTKAVNWENRYNELKKQYGEYELESQRQLAERDNQIVTLQATLAEEKPLGTKEQESLLKILAAMAVDGYGYNPAVKNSATAAIANVLQSKGMSLDDDTIRNWLRKASKFLPQKTIVA